MIDIRNLTKSFIDGGHKKTVLEELSLSVSKGQSAAITGESGCGKSTLLNILASLDSPDSGSVLVNNQDLTRFSESNADQYRQRDIGIVFQQYNLIDCLSVYENVTLTARLNRKLDEAYINELMEYLGIHELNRHLPGQLSGGEQQRVAIARSLAHRPLLLLADEPTGNLDDKNSKQVADLLYSMCELHQTSLILVTHSLSLAARADKHFQLVNGKMSEPPC